MGKGDLLELRHDDEFDQFLTTIATDDAAAGDIIECRVPRSMPKAAACALFEASAPSTLPAPRSSATCCAAARGRIRRGASGRAVYCDARLLRRSLLTTTATGFTVEAAKTRAVEASDLVEHVGRMGSSPFEAASFEVALDEGCGMGFSAVHKVRAAACKALEEAILAPYEERAKTLELPVLDKCSRPMPEHYRDEPQICATVTSLDAAEAARAEGAKRIYMTTDALDAAELSPADALEQGIVPILDESAAPLTTSALTRGLFPAPRSLSATSLSLPWPPRLVPRRRSALACPCTTHLAWSTCRARSRRVLALARDPRSTRSSRLAPPRPQPGYTVFGRPRV